MSRERSTKTVRPWTTQSAEEAVALHSTTAGKVTQRELLDLVELADAAAVQRGCPANCGCTDCDLRADLRVLCARGGA